MLYLFNVYGEMYVEMFIKISIYIDLASKNTLLCHALIQIMTSALLSWIVYCEYYFVN